MALISWPGSITIAPGIKREAVMTMTRVLQVGSVVVGFVVRATSLTVSSAGQGTGDAVRVDADDIGGIVASASGPEAGVWVIAETTELPTKFAKIVVT